MRRSSILLLVGCLAACADEPSSVRPDTGATGGADVGVAVGPDGGLASRDAGPRDASVVTPAPDAGTLSCQLEKATAAIRLTGYAQQYELGDLAAGQGKLGFTYSWNQKERRLWVSEVASGGKLFDGPIVALEGSVPRALDFADGLFFLAGVTDATPTQPSVTRHAFVDPVGVTRKQGQLDGAVVAVARDQAGARTLGPAKAADGSVVMTRLDGAGKTLEVAELATSPRKKSEWDLAWSFDADEGVACGAIAGTDGEALALFTLSGTAAAAPVPTTEKLLAASKAEAATFGCRVAQGTELVAVAFAEGDGGARLVWVDGAGRTRAGPVPFLGAYRSALRYDVAAADRVTALAWLDDTNPNSPRIAVRVFPSPAAAPISLFAETDLNLGGFETAGRRVRLAAVEGGFLVAFDAGVKSGQTDLYVRRILCE